MFKIPEKIKIGFVDYRIEDVQRLSGEKMIMGEHFEEHACIQVAQHLAPSTKAKVLIHECLHAIFAQYGICVDEEERLIGQLSTGITEMIDQIVEFNQDEKEPKYGRLLIRQICEVDRVLTPLLDNNSKRKIMDTQLSEPVITKEEDPHGFCNMVKHTERLARLLKEQIDHNKKEAFDYKRIGKLANLIAEYYKKEGNGCGGNCHLVLDDGNLEDSDIQFCKGYCAHANDDDGLAIMREMLSLNPEERQKVYDTASVLTNPRYTNNLDNTKEKS